MKRNLLLTPGPTKVPPELCAALGEPIIHHRTPQFQQHLKTVTEGLKAIIQTQHDVYLLASSGTGGMEAAVVNLLAPGDKVIAVDSGKFGERWVELCQTYKADTIVHKVPWGKAPAAAEIKQLLQAHPDTKAVLITLVETSTGVASNVKAIGEVVKDSKAVLVVDAVSGLAVEEFCADAWHVDMCISGSHKGLMLPPGVGFVSASPKAIAAINACPTPRYYFDLREAKKAMEKTDTPFTPAIGVITAMVTSIKMILDRGLDQRFKHFKHLAQGTRAGAKALGFELYPDPACAANALTALKVPSGVDGEKLVKIMRDTHGISIAGGQDQLKGKVIRVAHMGALTEEDMLIGLEYLEKTLQEMGYAFQPGAGVAAARQAFQSCVKGCHV